MFVSIISPKYCDRVSGRITVSGSVYTTMEQELRDNHYLRYLIKWDNGNRLYSLDEITIHWEPSDPHQGHFIFELDLDQLNGFLFDIIILECGPKGNQKFEEKAHNYNENNTETSKVIPEFCAQVASVMILKDWQKINKTRKSHENTTERPRPISFRNTRA